MNEVGEICSGWWEIGGGFCDCCEACLRWDEHFGWSSLRLPA